MKRLKSILIVTIITFITFLAMVAVNLHGRGTIDIQLEKVAVVGGEEFIIQRLGGVCEDLQGKFYVLDRRAFKVYKFSPEGKKLLQFGRKGEGPGDMTRPYHISVSQKGSIVVTEDTNIVSYFDTNGRFLKRYNLAEKNAGGSVVSIQYAGPDLFYCEKSIPDRKRRQHLVSLKESVPGRELLTLPDVSISLRRGDRIANYLVRIHECTPSILFHHYKNRSVAGMSKEYKLLLLDERGKTVAVLKRDFKPQPSSKKEKDSFAEAVTSARLPEDLTKAVIHQMPDTKNIFDSILVSDRHVYVFRTKSDVTDTGTPHPADIFSLDGKFMGTIEMENKPVLITGKHMYIPEETDEEDLVVVKYRYKLSN